MTRSPILLAFLALGLGCVTPSEPVGSVVAAAHACSAPTDPCDDGDSCTTDRCDAAASTCRHMPIANCCETIADCVPPVCQEVAGCEPEESMGISVCLYRGVGGCVRDAGSSRDGSVDGDGGATADGSAGNDGSPAPDGDAPPRPRVRGGACNAGAARGGATACLLFVVLLLTTRRRSAAPVVLLLSIAEPTHAQRLERDAPTAPDDLAAVERAATEPARLRPELRIGVVFADDPLVAEVGAEERELVGERLGLSLAASVAFLERVRLAVRASLFVQDGLGRSALQASRPDLPVVSVGAPAVDGRVVILDRSAPVELALAGTLRLPVGTRDGFVRDSRVSVWPRLLLARELDDRGSFVALSLGVDVRPRASVGDVTIDSLWTFGLGAAVAVGRHSSITIELTGATVLAHAFDAVHSPLRATTGLRWASDGLTLHLWGGFGLSPGFGTPDALFGLAVGWRLPVELPAA
jgi:hypothetical protein